MRLLRPASEDGMVAVFLAAEMTSERYGRQDQPPGTIYRQIAENLRDGHLPPPVILLGEPGPANPGCHRRTQAAHQAAAVPARAARRTAGAARPRRTPLPGATPPRGTAAAQTR